MAEFKAFKVETGFERRGGHDSGKTFRILFSAQDAEINDAFQRRVLLDPRFVRSYARGTSPPPQYPTHFECNNRNGAFSDNHDHPS